MIEARRGNRARPASRALPLVAGLTLALLVAVAGCTPATPAPAQSGVVVPPPSAGSVTETVAAPPTQEPLKVRLDQEADVSGIVVSLAAVRSAVIDSKIPSDGTGPGVVVTIRIRNSSSQDYRAEQLQATLVDSAGNAGSPVLGTPSSRFPETVAAGAEASADFAFLVPVKTRKPVSVSVSVGAGTRAAIFSGDAPS